jgi:hypothetical protein
MRPRGSLSWMELKLDPELFGAAELHSVLRFYALLLPLAKLAVAFEHITLGDDSL